MVGSGIGRSMPVASPRRPCESTDCSRTAYTLPPLQLTTRARKLKLSAERLKKDELHRLYTLFLRQRLQGSAVAGRLEHEDALDQARRAQAYFDGEVEQ